MGDNTIENIENQKEDILIVKSNSLKRFNNSEYHMELDSTSATHTSGLVKRRKNTIRESKDTHQHVIVDIPPNAIDDIEGKYGDMIKSDTNHNSDEKNSDKAKCSDESDTDTDLNADEIDQSDSENVTNGCCKKSIINFFKAVFCNPCINYIAEKRRSRESVNRDVSLVGEAVGDAVGIDADNITVPVEQNNQNSGDGRTSRGWRIIRSIRNLRYRGSNRQEDLDEQLEDAFKDDSNESVEIETSIKTDDTTQDRIIVAASVDINDTTSDYSQNDNDNNNDNEDIVDDSDSVSDNVPVIDRVEDICEDISEEDDNISCSTQVVALGEDGESVESVESIESEEFAESVESVESIESEESVESIGTVRTVTESESESESEPEPEPEPEPEEIEIIKNNLKVIASLEPGNKLYEDYYGRLSVDNSYIPGLMRRLTGNSRSNTIPRVVKTIEDAKTIRDPEIVELVNDDVIKGLQNLIATYSDDKVSSALSSVASTGDSDDADNADNVNDVDEVDHI